MYAEMWVYMPIYHNGCVTPICNVGAIFVQQDVSKMCTVTSEYKHDLKHNQSNKI